MKNARASVASGANDHFRSRVRLRHLECFVMVARTGHLGRAGEQLGLTPPAVSKTLTELEGMVGRHLMTRQRAGTALTAEGMRFLRHALGVLEGLDAAAESLDARRARPLETVRIGALPSIVPALLLDAVTGFRLRHPDIGLIVRADMNRMLIDSLKADVFDLVLGRMDDPVAMEGLWFESLGPEPLLFAVRAGHPLAGAGPNLADILHWPLAVPAQGSIPRHGLESLLARHGLALPSGCLETADAYLGSLVTQATDTVWAAPTSAVKRLASAGTLSVLPIATQGTEEPIGVLRRADRELGASAQAFMREVRTIASATQERVQG